MIRSAIAVWLENTFRECPRPTDGPWPMKARAHYWEDQYWEKLAEEIRALDDKVKS